MPDTTPIRIAMIGSYVPRRCGIATFTNHLAGAISREACGLELSTGNGVQIVAMTDREGEYQYGPEVAFEIHQHRKEEYRNAAEIINTSRVDAVSLQHEYGLFGGPCGDYLFEFLDRLRKPIISTLHTVLTEPDPEQRDVMKRVCQRSETVIVMANRARMILNEIYEVPADRIRMIHHGVPDVPLGDTEPFKERFGLSGRPVILTFGLLSPGKGIETMLDAVAKVVPEYPEIAYIVLGVTHPDVRRESGEQYRLSLERRAVDLGIQKNILFHNRYVSDEDLVEYLQAADFYATPYHTKEQITSGTLAYAVATGKAIISTPYWHAQELLANGRGELVDFGNIDGFANALQKLLSDPEHRKNISRAAYQYGREMIWSRVAQQYAETVVQAKRTYSDTHLAKAPEKKSVMILSLPEIRLDHLFRISDDTGMLQHTLYATPDRRHGYTTDDNARALIVSAMSWSMFQDERVLPFLQVYLSFLHYAQTPGGGRFRNFMSFDRHWLENDGSDDCQGRVLWSLGYLISHAPNESTGKLATDLFRNTTEILGTLRWPRAWALSILGLHYYLKRFPDDDRVRTELGHLADRLQTAIADHESEDWPWFEDSVTYDNGRVPQALIIAGIVLNRQELIDRGLRVLQWLVNIQTAEEGHLSIIGNSWLQRNNEKPLFDQQPLEPAALIGACKAAYQATGDTRWLIEMRKCFEWYLGRNDFKTSMVDFKTRGCYDGLGPNGVNENQGAEAVLSWLISLLIMHEIQTGHAPEAE